MKKLIALTIASKHKELSNGGPMRYSAICLAILLCFLSFESTSAAEKSKKKKVVIDQPVVDTGGIKKPTRAVELNASDCRMDDGEVIIPGDDRCGKLGAPYCRKKNGFAACLTEQ